MPLVLLLGTAVFAVINKLMAKDSWTKSVWIGFLVALLLSFVLGAITSRPPEQLAQILSLFPGVINFSMIVMVSVFSSILLRIRGNDEEIEDTSEAEIKDCLLTMLRRTLIITCIWVTIKAIMLAG